MSRIDQALMCFNRGFNCSQAVLSTYSEEFGLNREMALKIAGAFGGGMGRMGETCGAVTGALMLIGLKYGMTRPEDTFSKDNTYRHVSEFIARFKSRNGSITCRELLGYDLSKTDDLQLAREKRLFSTICPKYVKDAAEIIEEILR